MKVVEGKLVLAFNNSTMNILFPTDFSENSQVALQYAIDLINDQGGKITLVHIFNAPTMEGIGMGSLDNFSGGPGDRLQSRVEQDIQKEAVDNLNLMATKYNLEDEQYSFIAKKGDVTHEIDAILKEEDFDLVVLAFRNEQSQRGIFFGGLANHLITTSKCPVIAVPPKAKYVNFKKIMYATDLAHDEHGALGWLVDLAKPHEATIRFIHVGEYEDDKAAIAQELCNSLDYDDIEFQVVEGTNIAATLLDSANEEHAELFSMTTHTTSLFQKIFHDSYSEEVLNNINIPFIGFSDLSNDKLDKDF